MTPEEFWSHVAGLGGVADDASVEALVERLTAEEAEAFAERVESLVEELLRACDVPSSHTGDTAEWLAAAVVAAGRETYEATLAAGAPLDPDRWAWDEAEALLVVAPVEGEDEAFDLAGEPAVTFQWLHLTSPEDVETAYDENVAEVTGALGIGPDPAFGPVPASDPAFDRALARHQEWPAGSPRLHLAVLEGFEEPTPTLWPSVEEPEHVVLVVPPAMLLEAINRVEVYDWLLTGLEGLARELSGGAAAEA
ncbi:hypothetical protein [Nocardioides sp. GY 10127]|uniref:hypothetical protein n=1 Tax=Nocardioides sp. GY 10127 TaxID=2569762 RepID=UPI0010A8F676|nr:hypothetical protein [Nocardioides sp. GY 10127]TIC84065.1 hypothetical protein E8D37_04460 [Nocardioides sp. GY 10127]